MLPPQRSYWAIGPTCSRRQRITPPMAEVEVIAAIIMLRRIFKLPLLKYRELVRVPISPPFIKMNWCHSCRTTEAPRPGMWIQGFSKYSPGGHRPGERTWRHIEALPSQRSIPTRACDVSRVSRKSPSKRSSRAVSILQSLQSCRVFKLCTLESASVFCVFPHPVKPVQTRAIHALASLCFSSLADSIFCHTGAAAMSVPRYLFSPLERGQ